MFYKTYIASALMVMLTLGMADSALAKSEIMHASYYSEGGGCVKCPIFYDRKGQPYHLLANGQRFNDEDPTVVAHKELPLGTRLRITNPDNDLTIVVEVKDRGPYVEGRDLDLSEGAKDKLELHIPETGAAPVIVETISIPEPAN